MNARYRIHWLCPECGEQALNKPPRRWLPAWGPVPKFSHRDGEPLCPVIGPDGYEPAQPQRGGPRRPSR